MYYQFSHVATCFHDKLIHVDGETMSDKRDSFPHGSIYLDFGHLMGGGRYLEGQANILQLGVVHPIFLMVQQGRSLSLMS